MPLWLQLHTEIMGDAKLFSRPDGDFRLWVGLMCLAKEQFRDGLIRGFGAADLKSRFGLKMTVAGVKAALQHFATCEPTPMIELRGDGSIFLINLEKRGNVKPFDRTAKERYGRWREKHHGQRSDGPPTAANAASNGRSNGRSNGVVNGSKTPSNGGKTADRVESREVDKEEDPPIPPKGVVSVAGAQQRLIEAPSPEEELFLHWKRVMGHPGSQFDDKREKYLKKTLERFPMSTCKAAIDGCRACPHNMGANEHRQRYDGLKVIFRDSEQIERFVALSGRPPVPLDEHGLAIATPRDQRAGTSVRAMTGQENWTEEARLAEEANRKAIGGGE